MDSYTDKIVSSWITTFAKDIKKKYPDAKIALFGSRARKDHLFTSDIDLIVISKYFKNIPFIKRDAIQYWNGDLHADILSYTPDEWKVKQKQIGIGSQIKKEMKVI